MTRDAATASCPHRTDPSAWTNGISTVARSGDTSGAARSADWIELTVTDSRSSGISPATRVRKPQSAS
jgi:hypothetical protein